MLTAKTLLLLVLMAGLLPRVADAQDPPPPPPPREGTVNISFVQTGGNTSTQSLGLDGDLLLRPPDWELRNKAAFVRVRTNDVTTAQAFTYLSRTSREITERLSGYGQYDYLRDVLGGIRHRNVLTGGLSWTAIEAAPHTLDVFGGFGYAHERRVEQMTTADAVFDAGATYRWELSDVAEFTDDLRYNLSLDNRDDWRLGHLAAVTAKLNELLSLKVSYDIRFRNAPPVGFKSTDTATAFALVAKF